MTLRDLHAAMDRAVLDAYGWSDVHPTCEFILDYEDEDDEADGRPSRRRKPWRYRWPDDIRAEVLGRLLALNAERVRGEAAAQTHPDTGDVSPGDLRPSNRLVRRDLSVDDARHRRAPDSSPG